MVRTLRFGSKEESDAVKKAAKLDKRSVNSYILVAIKEKIEMDKKC